MRTYDVIVTREGRWWKVSIPDLDGLTQARRLSEAPLMAREWIALWTDVELDAVAVNLTGIFVDGRDIMPERVAVEKLRATVDQAAEQLSEMTRITARELVDEGIPVRDVGEVLHVSPQRVSQLVNG